MLEVRSLVLWFSPIAADRAVMLKGLALDRPAYKYRIFANANFVSTLANGATCELPTAANVKLPTMPRAGDHAAIDAPLR